VGQLVKNRRARQSNVFNQAAQNHADEEVLSELRNQEQDSQYPLKYLAESELEFMQFPDAQKANAVAEKSQEHLSALQQ